MSNQRKPVATAVGILSGRDAIYLDQLIQTDSPSTVCVHGEINISLCSDYQGEPGDWLGFDLRFLGALAYCGWEIDVYPHALRIVSSFDVVQESTWAQEIKASDCSHYVLATYDYIYEIIAHSHELELGDVRKA